MKTINYIPGIYHVYRPLTDMINLLSNSSSFKLFIYYSIILSMLVVVQNTFRALMAYNFTMYNA